MVSEQTQTNIFKKTIDGFKVFVANKYKAYSNLLVKMFEDLKEPVMPMPTRVKAPKDAIDEDKADLKTLHDARIKLWVQQNDDLTQVMKSLYTIVYGQCTPLMKASLTSDKTFEQIKADCDVVKLLKLIRGICFRFDSTVNPYESLDEAMKQWPSIRQGKDESNSDYYHCFIASSNDSYGFTVESNLKQMPDTQS